MKRFIIISIIVVVCVGCSKSSSLNKAISQVENALEKVKKNKGNMTQSDWEALGKEVEEPLQVISKSIEDNKIGMMERLKLTALVAQWSVVVMEAGLTEMEKQTGISREKLGDEIEKAVKELERIASESNQ